MNIAPYVEKVKKFLYDAGYTATFLEAVHSMGEVYEIVFRDSMQKVRLWVIVSVLGDKDILGFRQEQEEKERKQNER